LREADLKKLLATCERDTSFTGRRDYALLRVLIDTGIRRAEVAGLRFTPADDSTQDVDLDQGILRVMGKVGVNGPWASVGAPAVPRSLSARTREAPGGRLRMAMAKPQGSAHRSGCADAGGPTWRTWSGCAVRVERLDGRGHRRM